MILVIFLSVLTCILIFAISLWVISAGNAAPFLDDNGKTVTGSISEKIRVPINGAEQGMFIKGIDKTKPVLMFLHGGPGMPEYAVSRQYPLVLENYFTVCWWEQRGAGLSYRANISPETMTFDQLIDDAIEVTNYLRKRFNQEKIYLMAHSGGTFIGIQAAAKAPELFHAYLAMSQITNQLESEKLAYKYMVEQFTQLGDQKMLRKFRKYPVDKINTPDYYVMRDAPMHRLGIGTTRAMKSVISGVFWPVMLNKEYTLAEKINIWRGKSFTTKTVGLWNKLVITDLTKKVEKLDIPVYFFHGKHDYTTNYQLAKDYFEKLQAPLKRFYSFEHSAHSPLFEEPEKMQFILKKDVLAVKQNHSDMTVSPN
ncbi:MAG: alpha/beta hydrolase [Prolixibacteraceae bacterium]|nr:alpha/beta hydrolase [Prolixibacteraceae bacterium]